MTDLFIEILSEEIPARFQKKASEDFKRLVEEGLIEKGLPFEDSEVLYSPRRLALKVTGIPLEKEAQKIERKGPRVDAPAKAIEGFLASVGLSLADCEQRALPKGDFLFAVLEEPSQKTHDILPGVIERALKNIPWPQSMRWGSGTESWVRPVHSLITLFNGEPLPFTVSFGDDSDQLTAGSTTTGHMFMSPSTFPVKDFKDYVEKLERSYVMVDPDQRREHILTKARELAAEQGLHLKEDPALLEEVTGLVEWPVVLMGHIDEAFMTLPQEILMTSMKVHQRYFSTLDRHGCLASSFIFVANMSASDEGQTIISGNERVLGARLSDAQFFWDQDRKKPLSSLVPDLKKITFQEHLGTVYDKTERLVILTQSLATAMGFGSEETKDLQQAAQLCKTDLVTEMVYEFPELQGIMGGYYAKAQGLSALTSQAIAEHYNPKGAQDSLPSTPGGSILALADRLDTLVGFFSIGLRPTGSRDPFALRRAVLGIIRLQERELSLTFEDLISRALKGYESLLSRSDHALPLEEVRQNLITFYLERLKIYWKDQGLRPDVTEAILAGNSATLPLSVLKKRIESLEAFLSQSNPAGQDLLAVYKRASNILEAEKKNPHEHRALIESSRSVNPDLFQQEEERRLWQALQRVEEETLPLLERHAYLDVFQSLSTLKGPLDAYFDHVTVKAEQSTLRENRLASLRSFQSLLKKVADFSKIGPL